MNTNLLKIVSAFCEANAEQAPWSDALGSLEHALDADACAVASHDYQTRSGLLQQSLHLDPDFVQSYAAQYGRLNPWVHHEDHFRSPGAVETGERIVPMDETLGSEFYIDWLKPQNLLHLLFGVVERQGAHITYILLARSQNRPSFDKDEIALLGQLLPHLRCGFRAAQRLRRVEAVRRSVSDALDAMPVGVVLLSAAGRVIVANRLAKRIIEAREILHVRNGGLALEQTGGGFRFKDVLARLTTNTDATRPMEARAFSVPRSIHATVGQRSGRACSGSRAAGDRGSTGGHRLHRRSRAIDRG